MEGAGLIFEGYEFRATHGDERSEKVGVWLVSNSQRSTHL